MKVWNREFCVHSARRERLFRLIAAEPVSKNDRSEVGSDTAKNRGEIAMQGTRMLVRILLLTSLALVLPVARAKANGGDTPEQEKNKKEVLKIEDEMFGAVLKHDPDTLDRIYADDVSYTYASGQIVPKAHAVDDVRSGRNTLYKLDHDDIHAHAFGNNTVVVTGRTQSTLACCEPGAKPAQVHRRYTDVYEKLDGRWQLIAHQVTNIEGQ